MKQLVCLALLLCARLPAQDRITRVVNISKGNPETILRSVRPLSGDVTVTADQSNILLGGPKASVEGLEAVIKQLDVAPAALRNIEVTVYMIAAGSSGGIELPDELTPVATQLKGVFPYKSFRLLDSFALRIRDGQLGRINGSIGRAGEASRILYSFNVKQVHIQNQDAAATVRMDGLDFTMKNPISVSPKGEVHFSEADIRTDVDVRAGQKVVVGKTSSLEGTGGALFLAISAKILE
jgi:hypothetical protein